MRKIPIGETTGQAYAFAFGRYFSILGVLWLPFLILGVAAYYALLPMFGVLLSIFQHAALHQQDKAFPFEAAQQMQRLNFRIWGLDILELAVGAIISVGIVKEALGLRKGFRVAYVWFGFEELLVAGAYLLLVVMVFVFVIAAVIVVAILAGVTTLAVGATAGAHSSTAISAVQIGGAAALVVFGVTGAGVYLAARLSFFIVPVTVAEREFGVFRSWELSKGNFWRILAVIILTYLPVLIVFELLMGSIVFITTVLPAISAVRMHPPKDPAAIKAFIDAMIANGRQFLPLFLLAFAIPLPVLYGLFLSPAAFAYRALLPANTGDSGTIAPEPPPLAEHSAVT